MAPEIDTPLSEIVSASVDGWCLFVTTGLASPYYREVSQFVEPARAAQITLLHLYLSTFTEAERKRMLADVDFFLRYADGFIRELLPHGKRELDFLIESRRVFKKAMRQILSRDADAEGGSANISQQERRDFLRGALDLTRNVDTIIAAWDLYREFLYRKAPLIQKEIQFSF